MGGDPVFFERAAGPYLFDADDQRYIDYVGSWGPMVLGHAHPEVIGAVSERIGRGLSFGAPTELETRMADLVCDLVPSMDLVRMVSSGTEATIERHPPGPGFHRAGQAGQVRGVLPRPLGLAAGQGRVRGPDPGRAKLPGVPAQPWPS